MAEPPLLFERYRLIERLGRGAYATVYSAYDTRMGRVVAIKVIEDAADVDGRALREAQTAAKLDHPHIVTVHEVLRDERRTLLITEYVDGVTVREAFSKRSLSDRQIIELGIQVCRGLEHAHRRGVVHRDIKPENLMLCRGEEIDVRIMDFGVARLEDAGSITLEGELVGTLAYMAPEQAKGCEAGPKADVFALGLVLFEGLSGTNPLRGKSLSELTGGEAHRQIPPFLSLRPDVPPEVAEAVEAAIALDETVRVDAAALRRLLEKAARAVPDTAPRVGIIEKTLVRAAEREMTPRLRFVGSRLISGALTCAALSYLMSSIPFYPPSSLVYLVAACSFVSLLWPTVGNLLALGLLAPCVWAFAPAWGILYCACVFPSFALLAWRGCGWTALLPVLSVPLGSVAGGEGGGAAALLLGGLALCLPFFAGVFARFVGPLLGFWSGFALAAAAGFEGWSRLPFTFGPGGDAVLVATRYSWSVWDALLALARFLDARPELQAQIVLMTLCALPIHLLFRGSVLRRLWIAAGYLCVLGVGLLLGPLLAFGADTAPWRTAVALVPCVIIVVLSSVLFPWPGRER